MRDRLHHLAAAALLVAAVGCQRAAVDTSAFDAAARAIEAKERGGEIDAAAHDWRQLATTASTAESRAIAEFGRARCEAALDDRAHGIHLLESLPGEVERHSLASLSTIAAEQAARFAGGPFEAEFRELQAHVRDLCRERSIELRSQQVAAARALLARGEFCATLDAVQAIERSRELGDRDDIVELLEATNAASELAADALLLTIEDMAKTDRARALQRLDQEFARFQGSSGAARIALAHAAYVEIAREAAAGTASEPGKRADEHDV